MSGFDLFLMKFKEVEPLYQSTSSSKNEIYNEQIKCFVQTLKSWFNLEFEEIMDQGKHVGYSLDVNIEKNKNFAIYNRDNNFQLCHIEHRTLVLASISSQNKLFVYVNNLDRLYQLMECPMDPLGGRLYLNNEEKKSDKKNRVRTVRNQMTRANQTGETGWVLPEQANKLGSEAERVGLILEKGAEAFYTLKITANRDFYIYTDNNRRWLFHRELNGVPIAVEEQQTGSKTKKLVIFEDSIKEVKKCLEKKITFTIPEALKNSEKAKDFIDLIKKTINAETKFIIEENGTYVLSTTDTEFQLVSGILESNKRLFFGFPSYEPLAFFENGELGILESDHNTIKSLLDEQSFSFPCSVKAQVFVKLLEEKFFLKEKILSSEDNTIYTFNPLGTDFIIKKLQNGEQHVICKFGSIYPVAIKKASGDVILHNNLLSDIIENIDAYQLSRMRHYSATCLQNQKAQDPEIENFWKKSDLWASTRQTIIYYVLQRMDRPEFISTTGQFFCCCTPSKTKKFEALNLLFQGKELSRNNLYTLANMGYLRDLLRDVIREENNTHGFYPRDKHLTIEDLILALGYSYDAQSQFYKMESESNTQNNTLAPDVSILPGPSASPEIFKSPLPNPMTPYKTPFKPQPKGILQYLRETEVQKTPIQATYISLRDLPAETKVEDHVLECLHAWLRVKEQQLKQPPTKTPKKSLLTRGYHGAMASLARFSLWNNPENNSTSERMVNVVSESTLRQPLVARGVPS